MNWKKFCIFIVMIALASPVIPVGDADAKRKKRRYIPTLKILDISATPTPFAPGGDPLEITIDVGLPKNLSNVDLLEISSMITFPSKRSIRFLYSRHALEEAVVSKGKSKITTTLLWDGKDHTDQLVSAGTYQYEIRAKLMSSKDGSPRTKTVSLRSRGKLEVSSPPAPSAPPEPTLDHEPFGIQGIPSEEGGATSEAIEAAEIEKERPEDIPAQIEAVGEPITENVSPSVSATPEGN
jgi:hypothetical protein